jgi:hypothetical protein
MTIVAVDDWMIAVMATPGTGRNAVSFMCRRI